MPESNRDRCYRCGAETEAGFLTATGLVGQNMTEPRVVFVVPGEPTATNPLAAFRQGIEGVRQNQAYLMHGRRCAACGTVELVATEQTSWEP